MFSFTSHFLRGFKSNLPYTSGAKLRQGLSKSDFAYREPETKSNARQDLLLVTLTSFIETMESDASDQNAAMDIPIIV